MTLSELKTKADSVLVPLWKALVEKQNVYFAKHGKYFQLLITPDTKVVDGVDRTFMVRHPSDVKALADIDFSWSTKIPFQIQVDEWVGAKADVGFSMTVTVELPTGAIYTRTRTSRNEDTGWVKYVEPITQK